MKRNDDDRFDSAIRKKLGNREEEVPGYLWQNIEKKAGGRNIFSWLTSLNGLFLQDVIVTVSLLSFIGINDAASVVSPSSSSVNKFEYSTENTNSVSDVVVNDNALSSEEATSIEENKKQSADNVKRSSQKTNLILTEKNKNAISSTENASSSVQKNKKTFETEATQTKNRNHNEELISSSVSKKRKNSFTSGDNSYSNTREELLLAELLPVIPFNISEENDSLKYINKEKNPAHKFRLYPAFRIAAGTSFIDGMVKTTDPSVITEDHSRKAANGTVFQLLFEYPLSEKWNLVAGIGQSRKDYSWTFMTTEEIMQQLISTRQGFIISPFDPPIPITIIDTSYTKVALKNTAEVNWSLQTTQLYFLGERNYHNRVVDVRADAGFGVYLLNRIKEEVNVKGEEGKIITVKNSYSTSPKISALAAIEINRSAGILQPFIRIQAEQLLQNQFKSSSSILYKEGSLTALIGIRLRFVK